MWTKSLKLQAFIFSLNLLKFINYLPIILLILFYIKSFDNSLAFCMPDPTPTDCVDCNNNTSSAPNPVKTNPSVRSTIMDGMNCHYQVDPITKQPITNKDGSLASPVCKTNFGFMVEALRDIAIDSQPSKSSSSTQE